MDSVVAKCAKCDARLGSLPNSWVQIGKKYITPATRPAGGDDRDPSFALSVTASGDPRLGDADTLVGGCQLREAECARCRTNIGQKCIQTPVNHVLNDGQIIFRIASIVLKSGTDLRRRAEPKIERTLKLKSNPPTTNGHARAPTHETPPPPPPDSFHAGGGAYMPPHAGLDLMQQLQATLDVQRRDINRIGATGMQVVTNFETAIAKVDRQMQQLSDSIDSVRREGNGGRRGDDDDVRALKSDVSDLKWDCQNSSSVLSRLDQQLQTTDRVVTELRQALSRSKSDTKDMQDQLASTQQDLQDVGSLREQLVSAQQELQDVESLREQLASTQQDLQESREEVELVRNDMQDMKHELRESKDEGNRLRSELVETKQAALEGLAASKEYASEVSSLRREIKQLRAELARDRAHPPPATSEASSFSSHELDILTSSISKIGNRASQVESLQMEFDLFRTRIQRLEARSNASSGTPNRGPAMNGADMSAGHGDGDDDDENMRPFFKDNARKKRASAARADTQDFDTTPPKRMALSSSDFGSGISATQARSSDVYRSSPAARGLADPAGPRRTRAAASLNSATKRSGWKARS
ncbi:spc7 kinetochore protein domain-containing protein [Purpureocillium lavendulum]|uniref:Spc7 kinetochore protein domain-containing protein n=1 Tax=Purpureocillium lavendulum TaxID=1247861 RepID=A0AB34G3Y8_9HYPO|nr:spc7 kinetochore protein domain-containing protein [Purpureocillium lavendulum]